MVAGPGCLSTDSDLLGGIPEAQILDEMQLDELPLHLIQDLPGHGEQIRGLSGDRSLDL